MRTKTLRIEMEIWDQHAIHMDSEEFTGIVRNRRQTMDFRCTLLINGRKTLRRTFTAYLSDADFEDEENLAEKIIKQLALRSGPPEIWDTDRIADDSSEWIEEIELSDEVKEWFSFLGRYKQKLLEVMI